MTAIRAAMLDLLGKYLDPPVAALLGGGRLRLEGSVRVAQLCHDLGLTWGLPLEQPLRHLPGDGRPVRSRRPGPQ
ncbi:hypothetical protein [Actinomyces procaprae]|uniref:hypothetical protein n=1 Tax=Actinomyces procaprae TaxID=2560010 RepID=UPI001959A59D|nr:hypothetical protein [Actinomyces procaprae]